MTPEEMQNARQIRTQRDALVQDHLRKMSGQDTRAAEQQRQVQAARAASMARFTANQEAQAQIAADRAAKQAEREAQRAQMLANRATVNQGSVTRFADVHPPHVSRNVDREAQIAAFGHPVDTFILRKLPYNDPKAAAY